MLLTTKEKWIVDKLVRDGWNNNFHDYSADEMMLWKKNPEQCWGGFNWINTMHFFINRQKGLRIEYRKRENPHIHHICYLSWLGVKNWHEIQELEDYLGKLP